MPPSHTLEPHPETAEGTYNEESLNGTCVSCPMNSTTDTSSFHPSVTNCKCNAGHGSDSDVTACVMCSVDFFKNTRATQPCSLCPANSTMPHTGSNNYSCLDGYFALNTNLSYTMATEDSCVPSPFLTCAPGQYQDGVLSCANCSIGVFKAKIGVQSSTSCKYDNHRPWKHSLYMRGWIHWS